MKHIHPLPLLWIIHPASAGLCSIRFPLQRGGNHFPLIIVYQWPSWQLKLSVLLHWHEYIQYSEVLVSNPASRGCLTASCRQVMWHERYRVILEDVTPTRSCRSNMHSSKRRELTLMKEHNVSPEVSAGRWTVGQQHEDNTNWEMNL